MIRNPDLIHYVCIARGTTVLAEFNSKDAALGTVAAKCLDKTPRFHATFTHTVRSNTYAFLIDDPFVYFVIFDEKLDKSDGLAFLEKREAFVCWAIEGRKTLGKFELPLFQGEFNPVFRQFLGSGLDHLELIGTPMGHRLEETGISQCGSGPISKRPKLNCDQDLKKVKNRLLGELNIGRRNGEKKDNDENRGKASGLSRELSPITPKNGGLYSAELPGNQKAKKVWKKQVWVILSLDAIICVILFVVWLWVCRGFKCIDS